MVLVSFSKPNLLSSLTSRCELDLDLSIRDSDEAGGLAHLALPCVLQPEALDQLHHQRVELQSGKPLADARPAIDVTCESQMPRAFNRDLTLIRDQMGCWQKSGMCVYPYDPGATSRGGT